MIALAAVRERVQNSVRWNGVRPVWSELLLKLSFAFIALTTVQPLAPIDENIEHVYVRFPDIPDITPYKGPPTDAVDKAWDDLYQFGLSGIPKSMAAKLEGPTVKYYDDQDHYMVTLDVFHQLHCLNGLRKSLYPDRYPRNNLTFHIGVDHTEHLDHCANSIRESLMCNADTTPNRWIWSPEARVSDPHFTNVHTCKNWNTIAEFGRKYTAKTRFDRWHYAPDDLVYPKEPYKNVIENYVSVDVNAMHNYDYSYLDKIRPVD
ncbi:hypothetical protein DL93DRAFT_2066863 [Clavulina sp. PMI_390]|nr:hypothetical protein DL93DRAFT_2066863 [Clavulina sp. PMI_390]